MEEAKTACYARDFNCPVRRNFHHTVENHQSAYFTDNSIGTGSEGSCGQFEFSSSEDSMASD